MNWSQFKDPVFNMCLAGTVVACWSFTQDMAGSSPFTVMTNIFVTEFSKFSETFRKNSNISRHFLSATYIVVKTYLCKLVLSSSDESRISYREHLPQLGKRQAIIWQSFCFNLHEIERN